MKNSENLESIISSNVEIVRYMENRFCGNLEKLAAASSKKIKYSHGRPYIVNPFELHNPIYGQGDRNLICISNKHINNYGAISSPD